MAERGCNDVLVEAGPKVLGSYNPAARTPGDECVFYRAKGLGRDSLSVADFALADWLRHMPPQ